MRIFSPSLRISTHISTYFSSNLNSTPHASLSNEHRESLKWFEGIIKNRYGDCHFNEAFKFKFYCHYEYGNGDLLSFVIDGTNAFRHGGVSGLMCASKKIGAIEIHYPKFYEFHDSVDFNKNTTWELIDKVLTI